MENRKAEAENQVPGMREDFLEHPEAHPVVLR